MVGAFTWLTVIVDGVTAVVFLHVGVVAAHRLLKVAGAALMGTAVLMFGAIVFDDPDIASYGYAIGWVLCFVGFGLIVRPSKR